MRLRLARKILRSDTGLDWPVRYARKSTWRRAWNRMARGRHGRLFRDWRVERRAAKPMKVTEP